MPHAHAFDSADAVARLELEGEVTAGIDARAIARCRDLLAGTPVRRVVDLGSGPGVASAALAAAFPDAEVVAVDSSAAMLERAATRGVTTARLDLDVDLSALGRFELGWSSMAIHHAADERAAVARFAALVAPGGVLCLLEHAAPTTVRLLGDDRGRPGLWDRLDAARARRRRNAHGDSAVYPDALRDADLDLLADETLTETLRGSERPVAAAFAADRLRREARGLAQELDDADLAALGTIDDHAAAEVSVSRRVLVARRPGGSA